MLGSCGCFCIWSEGSAVPCCFRWRFNRLGAASSCVCASLSLPCPGSPAGGRDGTCLTLDQVVRCSSTSGAEFEFWRPWTLCWSPVCSTLWQLENLSDLSRLWLRFSSSHCWSAPSLEAPQRGLARFCG